MDARRILCGDGMKIPLTLRSRHRICGAEVGNLTSGAHGERPRVRLADRLFLAGSGKECLDVGGERIVMFGGLMKQGARDEMCAVRAAHSRSGSRVLISWSSHPLPPGSLDEA
jgi:hypothetical protein